MSTSSAIQTIMLQALRVVRCPTEALALTNKVFISSVDCAALAHTRYVQIKEFIYVYESHPDISSGSVGLTSVQRNVLVVALNDLIEVEPYVVMGSAAQVQFSVDYLIKKKAGAVVKDPETYNAQELKQALAT
jgi:hypothetical protein